MAASKIILEVRLAWWFLYLYVPCMKFVLAVAHIFNEDVEPDPEKLDCVIKKAIVVRKT